MSTLDQSQVAGSTLGYAQITASVSSITSTTQAQITGLTATVTIPAGGRRVKITGYIYAQSNTSAAAGTLGIWDGTVGTGTQLNLGTIYMPTAGTGNQLIAQAIVTPAAGSKTYNLGFHTSGGTGTITASTTVPAFILVELI